MRATLPNVLGVIALLALAGCASERDRVQETEQMLIALGFPLAPPGAGRSADADCASLRGAAR
jgi:hypothetical protein